MKPLKDILKSYSATSLFAGAFILALGLSSLALCPLGDSNPKAATTAVLPDSINPTHPDTGSQKAGTPSSGAPAIGSTPNLTSATASIMDTLSQANSAGAKPADEKAIVHGSLTGNARTAEAVPWRR